MKANPIKTERITEKTGDLLTLLDKYLPNIPEGSVLAVTSKIVSLCEGSVASLSIDKDELIIREADYYLPRSSSKYNVCLTIKDGVIAASSGIDESNVGQQYVLLPRNSQKTANEVRQHFTKKFGLQKFGVIVTDSVTTPLRWGTRGTALAHSGFLALRNYVGQEDLFGRPLQFSQTSVVDGLAATAVMLMGEGSESQPLVLMEDLPFVDFQDHNPTDQELKNQIINPKDDLYAPILTAADWRRGRKV